MNKWRARRAKAREAQRLGRPVALAQSPQIPLQLHQRNGDIDRSHCRVDTGLDAGHGVKAGVGR